MKAIAIRCPNCKASLRVDGTLSVLTCEYCGAQSRVQRRTQIFNRPLPPPPPPPTMPQYQQLPVAVQRVRYLGLVMTILPVLVIGLAGFFVSRTASRAMQRAHGGGNQMRWNGGGAPLLTDADGDGAADAIGLVCYIISGDHCHIAAFSGVDGHRLWQGEALGPYNDVYPGRIALAGAHVLWASPTGEVHDFNLADGKATWTATLPEKVETLCQGGDGAVAIETADHKWFSLALADGKTAERAAMAVKRSWPRQDDDNKGDPCVRLATDAEHGDGAVEYDDDDRPTVDGMTVSFTVRRGDGPLIASGYRSPGSAVPLLARLDDGKLLWRIDVPKTSPLRASATYLATLDDEVVCTVYEPGSSKPPRLGCFALADGKRRWDAGIDEGTTIVMRGLGIATGRVFMSSWGHLQVFDLASGEHLYTVGQL